MDDLVAMRTAVGLAFMEVVDGCPWLTPQHVLEGCVSSWYTGALAQALSTCRPCERA